MKKILEQGNLLYITDGKKVRVLNTKTWDAKDTTNLHMLKKVLKYGGSVSTSKQDKS